MPQNASDRQVNEVLAKAKQSFEKGFDLRPSGIHFETHWIAISNEREEAENLVLTVYYSL